MKSEYHEIDIVVVLFVKRGSNKQVKDRKSTLPSSVVLSFRNLGNVYKW